MRTPAPACFKSDLLFRTLAYQLQVKAFGGLDRATERLLDRLAEAEDSRGCAGIPTPAPDQARHRASSGNRAGTAHRVVVTESGFAYAGQTYTSLSEIARLITGTNWNGPRFFGLRQQKRPERSGHRPHGGEAAA